MTAEFSRMPCHTSSSTSFGSATPVVERLRSILFVVSSAISASYLICFRMNSPKLSMGVAFFRLLGEPLSAMDG